MKKIAAVAGALALGAAGLYGCWGPSQNPPTPVAAAAADDVTVMMVPGFGGPEGDREVLAVIDPYSTASIYDLEIRLEQAGSPVQSVVASGPAASGGSDLNGKPIAFKHLRRNTAYTVHWKVRNSSLADIHKPAAPFPLNIGNNDAVATVSLNIALQDRLFDGTASSAINIIPGAVTNPASGEAIVF